MVDIDNLVCSHIKNLQPYSSARSEMNADDGIFLDANENPYGNFNRYPDPSHNRLKERLAELKNIPSEQIFLGNGSDEIIDLLFKVFCNPATDKVLTFDPTFGMYETSARINNVELVRAELSESFDINIDEVKPFLTDSAIKLIFICSPNNPTGNVISTEAIQYLLKNFEGILVIDEAYIDFSSTRSWKHAIEEHGNLVVLQTLSKAWGLAGLRIGMSLSNSLIIKYLRKVKAPYNLSSLAQEKALERLNDIDSFRKQMNTILTERGRVAQALEKMNLINKVYPSQANFLLVEVNNVSRIYNRLVRQNIVVRNRSKQVDQCLRITIGSPEQNDLLISELKKITE
jgi:histidinol-phosphate aminotransferase